MSIKGIDAQIMITRLPDNVRDMSASQKRTEVAQEYLAAQGKVRDAHDQSRVTRTQETEMERIRTDVDKESSGGSGGSEEEGGKAGKEDKYDTTPELLVPPGNNVIDIKI